MRIFAIALLGLVLAYLLPAPSAEAQTFRLRAGDVVAVEVLEDSSLNREVLVLPDGSFNFPFAGTVRAGGRTPSQIESQISRALSPNFAAPPNVFVTVRRLGEGDEVAEIEEKPTYSIYFLGEVGTPGIREVEPGTTLLQALSQAGGFTNFAAFKRLQLRRTLQDGRQQQVRINYQAILDGAPLSNDFPLADGDVIVVPQRRLFE